MMKLNEVQKFRKPWIVIGMLLSFAVIGVGGCGAKTATTTPATSTTQASTSMPDAATTQSATSVSDVTSAPSSVTQPSTSSQQKQGQTTQPTQPALNPAIEVAMGIRRLQDNQQMALTSDQKSKIKPILLVLIDTSNPSQDFLQQKADAIKAVFTEQQKSYISTNAPKDKPNGNPPNGNGQPSGPNGAPNDNKTAPSFQPQDIFKQVLSSLT